VKCNIDCGIHGKCLINNKDKCQCDAGWTGENCMKKTCSDLCQQCDDNGNCLCQNGFSGRYCQIGLLSKLNQKDFFNEII
jgi:3-phytase